MRCIEDQKGIWDGNMGIVLDVIEGLFRQYEYGGKLGLTDETE